MEKKIVWYASGGGVAKTGPFDSQVHAYNAMRLTKESRAREGRGDDFPFPKDIVVWPEYERTNLI